jgi:periplasmic divalent cation tolerance protein
MLVNSFIVVLVTTSSKQEAETIAQSLLESKLIACANVVGPVESHFHWKGKIEHAEEFLLLMKSRSDLFDELVENVKRMHSYEVPEVVALPIVEGLKSYLGWLESSLK